MAKIDTIDVAIPIDAAVAPALQNNAKRALAGRLISRMLQTATTERLFDVMDRIAIEAEQRGLTDDMLDAELAAYNSERRTSDAPSTT